MAKPPPTCLCGVGSPLGTFGWCVLANSGALNGGVPTKAYGGVASVEGEEEEEADGVRHKPKES